MLAEATENHGKLPDVSYLVAINYLHFVSMLLSGLSNTMSISLPF